MGYWIITAWIMGFVGSAHCVGMCGPLALSLPIQHETPGGKLFQTLLYNLGRALTYAALGALVGVTHEWLVPTSLQNALSFIMGATLLLLSVYYLFVNRQTIQVRAFHPLYRWVNNTLGILFRSTRSYAALFIGLLNGLLPCGLVYLALATAFASGKMLDSTLFMFFFGMGTLPAMWSMSFLAHWFSPSRRALLRRVVPWVYALSGVWLILRGLGDHNPLQDYLPHQFCSKY